jgi:hypothetical protein
MPKITMSLTEHDIQNTEKIREVLEGRSNAHAVSIALSLTAFIVDQMLNKNEVLLRDARGELCRIAMAELELVRRTAV